MRKGLVWLMVFVLVLGLTGCGLFGGGNPQRKPGKPSITIGVTPWTTTTPPSNIVKNILEGDLGYKVNLQQGDVGVVYNGLASGSIDVFLDAWLPHMHQDYMERFGDKIEDVGTSYEEGVLGWVVPSYVPVNSIAELNQYKDKFDRDGNGSGDVIGIDAGAGMNRTSDQIINDYGLDYELIEGSEFAMLTTLQKAYANQDWILFLGWRPHWMFAQYDLKFLDDPKGIWQGDQVHTLVRKGLEDQAPEAVRFLRNWKLPVEDLEQMIYEMQVNERPVEEIAKEWIENNREGIDKMLGK
ncbi:MAG: glycine betaine ABC transporter substrate-binding protein [bacterium]|jgi:glycine betaine/proline transport system substrate-binding protein